MIIGRRQAKFDAIKVPEIDRWNSRIEFSHEWLVAKNSLVKALLEKYAHVPEYKEMIEDCVSQSLNFMMIVGATKDLDRRIIKIELWKGWIQLAPIHEGINMQLNTMLIKHHFPSIYKNMTDESKPVEERVYSHYGLTVIGEAVLYTMEFLKKYDLLKEEKEFLERDNVKNWLNIKENQHE